MKIYLSKSYASSPDHVILIRHFLELNDVNILEYKGGAYDEDAITKNNPDLVIVIPPHLNDLERVNIEPGTIALGRGVAREANQIPERTLIVVPDLFIPYREPIVVAPIMEKVEEEFPVTIREPKKFWKRVDYTKLNPFYLNKIFDVKLEDNIKDYYEKLSSLYKSN